MANDIYPALTPEQERAMYAPGGNSLTYNPPTAALTDAQARASYIQTPPPAPIPQPLTQAESIASYIQTPPVAPPPAAVAPPVQQPQPVYQPPQPAPQPAPQPVYQAPPQAPQPTPAPVPTIDEAKLQAAQDQQANIQAQYAAQAKGIMENIKPYVSSQAAQIEQIRQQTFNTPFAYNPATDNSLKQAQQQSMQSVQEEMNRRGILSSTVTGDRSQKVAQELVPQYEALAYTKFNQNIQNQLQNINVLKGLDDMSYNTYKTGVDQQLKNLDLLQNLKSEDINLIQNNIDTMFKVVDDKRAVQLQQIKLQDREIQQAQDRTEALGYVNNRDAIILGVPVGTPSKAAAAEAAAVRERIANSKIAIEQSKEIAKNDYELDKQRNADLIALKQKQQGESDAQVNFATQMQGQLSTIPATVAVANLQKLTPAEIAQIGAENYSKMMADSINRIPVEKKTAETEQLKAQAAEATSLLAYLQQLSPEEALAQLTSGKNELIAKVGAENFQAIMAEQQKRITDTTKQKQDALKLDLDAQQVRGEITAREAQTQLNQAKFEVDKAINDAELQMKSAANQANINQSNAAAESSRASAARSYAEAQAASQPKTIYAPSGEAPQKPLTATEKKNEIYNETVNELQKAKQLSVADMTDRLKSGESAFVDAYGQQEFDKLWNTVLTRAIEAGQADSRGIPK